MDKDLKIYTLKACYERDECSAWVYVHNQNGDFIVAFDVLLDDLVKELPAKAIHYIAYMLMMREENGAILA